MGGATGAGGAAVATCAPDPAPSAAGGAGGRRATCQSDPPTILICSGTRALPTGGSHHRSAGPADRRREGELLRRAPPGGGAAEHLPPQALMTEGLHGVGPASDPNTTTGGSSILTATQFPQAFGLGESWDPQVTNMVGATAGYEARVYHARGVSPTGRGAGLVMRAAQRRSRARSALGAHRGILRRGSLPDRRAGQELPGRPARHRSQVPAGGVDAEALHGQQQRRHAHDQLVEPGRSQPARVLLGVVRQARCAAARRRDHDRVQPDQRRARPR